MTDKLMQKVCTAIQCEWKHKCAIYFQSPNNRLHVQYMAPQDTGEHCHTYQPLHQWGEGKDGEE